MRIALPNSRPVGDGAATSVGRLSLTVTVLFLAIIAPASADVGATIIDRCTHGQSLSGFSQQDYRRALQELPTEVEEYSDCGSLIRNAQIAAAGGRSAGAGAAAATPTPLTPAERRALNRVPKVGARTVGGRRHGRSSRRGPRRRRLGPELIAKPPARDPGVPARVRARACGGSTPKPCPRPPLPLSARAAPAPPAERTMAGPARRGMAGPARRNGGRRS